jgi:threonine/homoserine/homoserine lactone efflux protein
MLTNLLLFAGVSLVVIVTPGPDTALTVRNALLGRRSGILTAVGVGTGQLAWALLTACGVASVLAAHQGALTVLRLAGAAYLVGLGAHALWASWHSPSTTPPPRPRHGARRSFAQGLVSDLANPKMAVFFLSLLPQFAGPDPSLSALAGLGLLFAVMTVMWLTAYALVVDRVRNVLQRNAVRQWIDRLTGVVLVGLGVRVATEAG